LKVVRATADTFRFRELVSSWLAAEDRCVEPDEAAPFSYLVVFPNQYQVGMSNLGFQSLYRLVNETPDWSCERAFLYPVPWRARLRSLESARRGDSFHVVGFSCSFEMDYLNALSQIASTGVPLRAADREEGQPLFVLGGAITFYNPVPLAPFFDVVVLGEAEPIVRQFLSTVAKGWGRWPRRKLLERLAELPGVWCPPLEPTPRRAVRLSWREESAEPEYSCIVSGEAHMEEMFLVEVGRGCGRRCRFCVASHVYWPLRMWPPEAIISAVREHNRRGYRVGLVGAALSDYPWLHELLEELVRSGFGFGLSSLRIDGLDEDLMALLESGGVRSVTLAPESASGRMQKVMHKNLRVERMLEAADLLARSCVERVKLYFLIGLPFERDEDVEETARFVLEFARRLNAHGRNKHLTVSVNAFIPKPHTPFQWSGMAPLDVLRRRRRVLREILGREKGVELDLKSPRDEWLQAVLSVGGAEVSAALELAVREQLPLRVALARAGVDAERLACAERPEDAQFPWDFIQGGLDRRTLLRQWHLARSQAA